MQKNTPTIPDTHHDLLTGKHFAQVATITPKGDISNHVVAYVWDGQDLRFSTIKSRLKYKSLIQDPRVGICVVDPENSWRYVEIRGTVTIEDDTDRSFINSIAKKYLNEDEYPFDQDGDERVTFTVKPKRIRAEYVHSDKGSLDELQKNSQ